MFKKVKSSSPCVGYNAITLLNNIFPVVTSVADFIPPFRVVSLFPEYFSQAYGVTDNSKIIVLNLVEFMSFINSYFISGNFDFSHLLFVFHGFRWSQIIHIFATCCVEISGVKVPVRHTINSWLIQLFRFLISLFGSLEEVGKYIIEGTDLTTFLGSAKQDKPVYNAKSLDSDKFIYISMEISPLISYFIRIKILFFMYSSNQNKLLAIQNEIDSFSDKKKSFIRDTLLYKL